MSSSSYYGTVQCARTSSVVLLFVSLHTTKKLNNGIEEPAQTQMAKIKNNKNKKTLLERFASV